MFSLICVWINGWVNNRETVDWRRYRAHYDVTVMAHANGCGLCHWTQQSDRVSHIRVLIKTGRHDMSIIRNLPPTFYIEQNFSILIKTKLTGICMHDSCFIYTVIFNIDGAGLGLAIITLYMKEKYSIKHSLNQSKCFFWIFFSPVCSVRPQMAAFTLISASRVYPQKSSGVPSPATVNYSSVTTIPDTWRAGLLHNGFTKQHQMAALY